MFSRDTGVLAGGLGVLAGLCWLASRRTGSLAEETREPTLEERAKYALDEYDFEGFTTAKGSTYEVMPKRVQGVRVGAATQRTKSYHPGHGEKDVGLKEASVATVYVADEGAKRIGMHGTMSSPSALVAKDGYVSLVERDERTGRWGITKFDRENPIPYSLSPAVGVAPIELWGAGMINGMLGFTKWHPGNKIVSVRKKRD